MSNGPARSMEREGMASSVAGQRLGARTWLVGLHAQRARIWAYVGFIALLTLLFLGPLARLMMYAAQTNLHSHIILIPFITGYLLYLQRRQASPAYCTSISGAAILGAIGMGTLVAGFGLRTSLSLNDGLALVMVAFVSLVAAGGFLFFGSKWMAARGFAFSFLIFMAPLPDAAANWLENASVLASADAAAWFFNLSGTPMVRQSTVFELPGIVLRVAQECSGIHSSWVLFITSLLATQLFLKTRWRGIVLVAFVIPLGILRNGFRIATIGFLCVRVGPHMVDSPIHHSGGPLFFALSLAPLFLLLWWLRRRERGPIRPG